MQIHLIDPGKVRDMFAQKKGWLTIEEIAAGVGQSTRTVRRALQRGALRPQTVREWADALGVNVTDIATFR